MMLVLRISATDTKIFDFSKLPDTFRDDFYAYALEQKNGRKKKESSLANECFYFFNYTVVYFSSVGMLSFSQINELQKQRFVAHLNTCISKKGTTLSRGTKYAIYSGAKMYFGWLARNRKDRGPKLALLTPNPFRKRNYTALKTKAIDDFVLDQIKKAVREEKNPYSKAFISVALYIGMRREDILELRDDCLKEDLDKPGSYILKYYNHKSDLWVDKSIPKNCSSSIIALKLLMEYTLPMREISRDRRLFLRNTEEGIATRFNSSQPKYWIEMLIKNHGIVDAKGNIPKVSPHMFRHTLLSNMDAAGIDVEHARYMADHKSTSTTRLYYIHSKDADYNNQMDVIDTMVEAVTLIDSIETIADSALQKNKTALRLGDGYCTDTKMATEGEYICEHYQRRGNCYGCSKMITTPDFLPDLKEELEALEMELNDKALYGENVQRHIHFRIEMLKQIIARLEVLKRDVA